MTVAALMAGASAWIGGSFGGERCEQCGRMDVLEPFRVEVRLGKKRIVREARLCRRCLGRAEVQLGCLPESRIVH